jgi:hypothetical protein
MTVKRRRSRAKTETETTADHIRVNVVGRILLITSQGANGEVFQLGLCSHVAEQVGLAVMEGVGKMREHGLACGDDHWQSRAKA